MSLNWLFRTVLVGPAYRRKYPATVTGRHKLPKKGPYILVFGPHQTERESLVAASNLPELNARFYIKASYMKGISVASLFMRLSGQIPINRLDVRASDEQIDKGVICLSKGRGLIAYNEGARVYDRHVHKGRPIPARTARRASVTLKRPVPVYPVALRNFELIDDPTIAPEERPTLEIIVGDPLFTDDFLPMGHEFLSERTVESRVAAKMMPEITKRIVSLSGYPYSSTLAEITSN